MFKKKNQILLLKKRILKMSNIPILVIENVKRIDQLYDTLKELTINSSNP